MIVMFVYIYVQKRMIIHNKFNGLLPVIGRNFFLYLVFFYLMAWPLWELEFFKSANGDIRNSMVYSYLHIMVPAINNITKTDLFFS